MGTVVPRRHDIERMVLSEGTVVVVDGFRETTYLTQGATYPVTALGKTNKSRQRTCIRPAR